MLEYVLIHVLLFFNWWAAPRIKDYAGKHYIAYPMLLYSLFFYGLAGILLARMLIKKEERNLSAIVWYLILYGDLGLEIYRAIRYGTIDVLLILLISMAGVFVLKQKVIDK